VLATLHYYAGLRIGEVVGLDLTDVALSARKGFVRVLGKGRDDGKIRTVPVHAELRSLLQRGSGALRYRSQLGRRRQQQHCAAQRE
jgi:site-specific recombinase XerC